MRDIVVGNPALAAVLGTGDVATETGVTRLLLSFAVTLGALIAAAQGVLMISRVAADETAGRIGLLAATRRPRLAVAGSAVIACAIASMATLAVSGFAVGAAAAATMHDRSFVAEGIRAAAAQAPAVAVILAVAILAWAATPRAVHLTWLEAASTRVSIVLLSLCVALAAVAVHHWRNRDLVAG
jgi:putative exporter of polyketide antibiotics